MAKQEVTAVQVQMAAAAGVKLLQSDDLMVPLQVAKGGALGILESMLNALANGEVILAPPPAAEPAKEGAPDAPLKSVPQSPKKDTNAGDKKPAAT